MAKKFFDFEVKSLNQTLYRSHSRSKGQLDPSSGQYGVGLYLAQSHAEAECFSKSGHKISEVEFNSDKVLFIYENENPGDDNVKMLAEASKFIGVVCLDWDSLHQKLGNIGFSGIVFVYQKGGREVLAYEGSCF